MEICIKTLSSASNLMKRLFSELNNEDHHLDVLSFIVTIVLYSLCKMEVVLAQMESSESNNILLEEKFNICEGILEDWIKRNKVVGGNFFGKKIQDKSKYLLYASTELKVNMHDI